jgi:hypothetical protein
VSPCGVSACGVRMHRVAHSIMRGFWQAESPGSDGTSPCPFGTPTRPYADTPIRSPGAPTPIRSPHGSTRLFFFCLVHSKKSASRNAVINWQITRIEENGSTLPDEGMIPIKSIDKPICELKIGNMLRPINENG